MDDAHVAALWVPSIAKLLLHRAAHIFTLVVLATLHSVTDLLALKVLNLVDFFLSHQPLQLFQRVVYLEAGNGHFRLSTATADLDWHLAQHAPVIVACFGAGVAAARKEFLADGGADGDGLDAGSAVAAQQFFYRIPPTSTELNSLRVFLTRLTHALMTHLLTLMVLTVKLLRAHPLTREHCTPTHHFFLLPCTMTQHHSLHLTRATFSIMAVILALVFHTV